MSGRDPCFKQGSVWLGHGSFEPLGRVRRPMPCKAGSGAGAVAWLRQLEGQVRNVLIFFAAIAVFGGLVLTLQYVPNTGVYAAVLGGPFWLGVMLHLALLAMLVLAAVGWLPRVMLAIPLAVWLGGAATWFLATRDADKQAALQTQIPLAKTPREIALKGGDGHLPIALAANYELDSVYSEFWRYEFATGADCRHEPRKRILWSPPHLVARGACVISQRAEPPAGLLEIVTSSKDKRVTASGGEIIPFQISASESGQQKFWTIEFINESIPAPLVYPIVGFFYGSESGERRNIAELWRLNYPIVAGAGDDNTNEAKARFIAQSIGLSRRAAGPAK
jgi:hypothetical protein